MAPNDSNESRSLEDRGATYELRDASEARRHVVQSLWLARSAAPDEASVRATLAWAMHLAASGAPLPSCGFVADVGRLALGSDHDSPARDQVAGSRAPQVPPATLPPELARRYEDYVLGKLYCDSSFARGADALLRYHGVDRQRGVAYLIDQFRQRVGFGGALLSPALLKSLAHESPGALLEEGWRAIDEFGVSPRLIAEYECMVSSVQATGEALGPEDVFELEQGTALEEYGQRLALRQTLQAAERLQAGLAPVAPRPSRRHHQAASKILDEDRYPVGGFSSISTRGGIESLLHSQLALMENGSGPDLFDMKYARDELLYYSRDENQFLRRRLTFFLVLDADLTQARVKDAEAPWQRIILTMASLLTLVRTLTAWLNHDALRFEILFPEESQAGELRDERELLRRLLHEAIDGGIVCVEAVRAEQVSVRMTQASRVSLCHALFVSAGAVSREAAALTLASNPDVTVGLFQVSGPRPIVLTADGEMYGSEEPGPAGWTQTLAHLLPSWL